jgi:CheY-like chemotaxis protein
MKKVLIMEDIPEHAFLVQHALVSLGFLTVVCHNTFRAIEMVRMNEYDAIVTDLRMPEMGGIEFIKYVRVINKNIPIVVLTAYADKDAKNETFIAGANYFIAKPFKQADIKRIFEQFK